MLAIGRALAGGPEIMILDEPSEGVQPNIVGQIGEAILNFRKQFNLSIILIDQNASLISNSSIWSHRVIFEIWYHSHRAVRRVPNSGL